VGRQSLHSLAKRGPIKAADAAKALKISKQRVYPIIKSLQSKGIVNSTLERPARFSAVPFEKVLDLFVKAKFEQAQRIQQNKDALLSDWQSIAVAEGGSSPAKFTVIEGRSYVYSKIQQMIQETKRHLSFVATVPSLARADQFGLFDAAFNHPSRSKIRFRFLTELSGQT
jgi:sugar-specific transcriptional regulator TrmB